MSPESAAGGGRRAAGWSSFLFSWQAASREPRAASARAKTRALCLILGVSITTALHAATLTPVSSRDRRVIKRWELSGTPHGVAVAENGTVYVGLAEPQSVVAINPTEGKILNEVVLDSAEIASTKELVTMRFNAAGDRLVIANGSDESVTILSIPQLAVTREITMEGEAIGDALPDPAGRHLYLLGSSVHVFDAGGQRELRTLPDLDPMAIATDSKGSLLAVIGSEDYGNDRATAVVLYETATWREVAREPLQTDRVIRAALFAAEDRSLVVLAKDWLAEKTLLSRPARPMTPGAGGTMRIQFSFGDLISSETICLPDATGPQIATLGRTSAVVVFAEKRCSASGSFTASTRRVSSASLYAINAWAIARHAATDSVFATDPAGYLTMYKTPKPGAQ